MVFAFLCGTTYFLVRTMNGLVDGLQLIPLHSIEVSPAADTSMDSSRSPSPGHSRQLAQDTMASGLFHVSASDRNSTNGSGSSKASSKISEQLGLIGIVLSANDSQYAILVERSTGKQSLYRVGQPISNIGQLASIEKNRVLVRSGLKEEWLGLTVVKTDAGTAPAVPELAKKKPSTHRVMDRMQLVQAAQTPEYFMKETVFHPHFNRNGNVEGYRLDGIQARGVLDNAGLQEDDILSGINGVEIRDPVKLWEMFRQFPREHSIHLNVMRQGEPVTLTVDIRG